MTVTRFDETMIGQFVGDADAKYLRNKSQGGENGWKGSRYETFFGCHRIAVLACPYIESGIDHQIEWQSLGFVDDYMVRLDSRGEVAGYQLKNTASASWTTGEHPISRDFELQHRICRAEGYESVRLTVVLSSEEAASALSAAVPHCIRAFSEVAHFPYQDPWPPLLMDVEWLRRDFAYLSNRRNPSVVDAQQVASIVMGAWMAKAPSTSVSAVLDQARQISPMLIRAFQSDEAATQRVSPELRAVLDAIPGFRYDVQRGFLHWDGAHGLMSGVLPFDCFSERFDRWQERVLRSRPATFEEMEEGDFL